MVAQGIPQFQWRKPCSTVSLAGKGEHGVGSGLDFPIDHSCKMYPKKRESGVRDRINEISDKIFALWFYPVVFAPERNDPAGGAHAAGAGDTIRIETGAIYENPTLKFTTTGFYPQCFEIDVLYFFDFSPQKNLSTLFSKH